jgi:hypothetical protein
MKEASSSWLALYPDSAALSLNQLFADGQAETGALPYARRRVSDLVKLVEDAAALL